VSDEPLIAGIELGGTKCICILGRSPDDIVAEQRIATTDPATTLSAVEDVLRRWHDEHGFLALGIASFGPLDFSTRQIVRTTKPGWSGAELARYERLGVPVALDTDVNGAAFAEGRWGAARDLKDFTYITVGTGVGVGSIVAGEAVRGLAHSEAGHLRIPRLPGDDWPGHCIFHGDCVEGLASGPAIAARGEENWEAVAHALAMLIHNLALTTAPQRVLVGGGVTSGNPHLLPRVREMVDVSLAGFAHAVLIDNDPDFVTAPALGDRAGPLGALALGLHALGR
jgi:fructokinase